LFFSNAWFFRVGTPHIKKTNGSNYIDLIGLGAEKDDMRPAQIDTLHAEIASSNFGATGSNLEAKGWSDDQH
jgi:hypothetical protein